MVNWYGYNEKYMTVKFNSDDVLSSNKTIEPDNIIILIRSVFHEGNKYYPHVILQECL